mgnify:CR=1 FL=1
MSKNKIELNRKDFVYAVAFYAFSLSLDAIVTIMYGDINLEVNKYVIALAKVFGFDLAVVIYSATIFSVVFTLSYVMYKLGLSNTSFGLPVVLAIFHLHGACTWIFDLSESIKIPAILTLIGFVLFDIIEKRGKLNELVRL